MNEQSTNRAYIDSFLTYLKEVRGYSSKTVESYGHDLLRLENYLSSHSLALKDFVFEDARDFTTSLYDEGLSPSSINRILSGNRSFFHHLRENHIINIQPFDRVSNAKDQRKIPTVLSSEEIESILNCPINDYTSLMEVTMFHLFYSTGCRLSEIMEMKISNIDFEKRRILVKGKGSKERYVFLTKRALSMLQEYLPQRKIILQSNEIKDLDTVIVNERGRELPLSTVHSIFDKYRKRLGITKKFTPHVFRHSFATHLMDNDSDIRLVQALLGHESIGTTQIYTHVTGKHLEEVYRNNHPHGGKK